MIDGVVHVSIGSLHLEAVTHQNGSWRVHILKYFQLKLDQQMKGVPTSPIRFTTGDKMALNEVNFTDVDLMSSGFSWESSTTCALRVTFHGIAWWRIQGLTITASTPPFVNVTPKTLTWKLAGDEHSFHHPSFKVRVKSYMKCLSWPLL